MFHSSSVVVQQKSERRTTVKWLLRLVLTISRFVSSFVYRVSTLYVLGFDAPLDITKTSHFGFGHEYSHAVDCSALVLTTRNKETN